jgi:hypothetical protein
MRTAEWVQAQLNRDHPEKFVTAKQRGDIVVLVRRDGKMAAWLSPDSLGAEDDTLKVRVDHCVAFMERSQADDAAPRS